MLRIHLPAACLLLLFSQASFAAENETLPNTASLTWTGDLSAKMLDGCHAFIDRKIAASIDSRQQYWRRDFSSPEAYEKSIADNRRRFARQIGAVDERLPVAMQRFGDDVAPDEWVASEFAKVRRLYDALGIGDRTAIEFFNGPHTINGRGTFEFLHRHLKWPEKRHAADSR